jgi:hypothetical protein
MAATRDPKLLVLSRIRVALILFLQFSGDMPAAPNAQVKPTRVAQLRTWQAFFAMLLA